MAFAFIMGSYGSYTKARESLREPTLKERRIELCKTFANKCVKNPRHSHLFPKLDPSRPLTRETKPFIEYHCRTKRFYDSAIPFLTRLLNENEN